MKIPVCKLCGREGHTKTFCFGNRKSPIASSKRLLRSSIKKRNKPLSNRSDSERAKLVREADRVFSLYVRSNGAVDGHNSCFTCGARIPWQELQNGHYISRRKMAVRYNPQNGRPQCGRCNSELGGNLKVYTVLLGDQVVQGLKDIVNSGLKITDEDLRDIIKFYNTKLDNPEQ